MKNMGKPLGARGAFSLVFLFKVGMLHYFWVLKHREEQKKITLVYMVLNMTIEITLVLI